MRQKFLHQIASGIRVAAQQPMYTDIFPLHFPKPDILPFDKFSDGKQQLIAHGTVFPMRIHDDTGDTVLHQLLQDVPGDVALSSACLGKNAHMTLYQTVYVQHHDICTHIHTQHTHLEQTSYKKAHKMYLDIFNYFYSTLG